MFVRIISSQNTSFSTRIGCFSRRIEKYWVNFLRTLAKYAYNDINIGIPNVFNVRVMVIGWLASRL